VSKPAAALWLVPPDGNAVLKLFIEEIDKKTVYITDNYPRYENYIKSIIPNPTVGCEVSYRLCQLRLKRGQGGNNPTCWLASIINGVVQDQRLFNHLRMVPDTERYGMFTETDRKMYKRMRDVMTDTTTDVLPDDLMLDYRKFRYHGSEGNEVDKVRDLIPHTAWEVVKCRKYEYPYIEDVPKIEKQFTKKGPDGKPMKGPDGKPIILTLSHAFICIITDQKDAYALCCSVMEDRHCSRSSTSAKGRSWDL
jgi:hypothetical protein